MFISQPIFLCIFPDWIPENGILKVLPNQGKCTRSVMQISSTERRWIVNPILPRPLFKGRAENNVIPWDLFCLLCRLLRRQRALCRDDSRCGREKSAEQIWSHSALCGSVVRNGIPASRCLEHRSAAPTYISAYYISWSGKHANNKCMSNVLVFLLD